MFGKHSVSLSSGLYERAALRARDAGYSSVDELVAHLLEKELDSGETVSDEATARAAAEKQLRGLGYIE